MVCHQMSIIDSWRQQEKEEKIFCRKYLMKERSVLQEIVAEKRSEEPKAMYKKIWICNTWPNWATITRIVEEITINRW